MRNGNMSTTESAIASGNSTLLKLIPFKTQIWNGEVIFRVAIISVIMAFSFIGNVSLIFSILYRRRQRYKRVNIFLLNLAFGDLMVCLVTMTTEILFLVFGEWVLGAAACKVSVYGQIVTLASTTFLLTGMSIDRYQVIVTPIRSISSNPKIWRKVIIAWILAFTFATPQLFIFVQTVDGIYVDGTLKHSCRSRGYTAEWQRKVYFSFLTTYILIIPAVIMSFCYINIIRVVWQRTDAQAGNLKRTGTTSLNRLHSFIRGRHRLKHRREAIIYAQRLSIPRKFVSSSKRNVIKMTLSVIVAFLVCWSPYFIVGMLRIYSNYYIKLNILYAIAEQLCMTHSALNPILYVCFSTRCRRTLWQKICGYCMRNSPAQTPTSTLDEADNSMLDIPTARRRQWSGDPVIRRCCCCWFETVNQQRRCGSLSDVGTTQVCQDLLATSPIHLRGQRSERNHKYKQNFEMEIRSVGVPDSNKSKYETMLVIRNEGFRHAHLDSE